MNIPKRLRTCFFLCSLVLFVQPLPGFGQQTKSGEPAPSANLVELDVKGPAGRIEALSLRLYNPESRQWSLNFASSGSGTLAIPAIGELKNGRGEFYNQDTLNGRSILVRFVISDITPTSCRFEQSFSDDGGKTWETNWIAVDTRIDEKSGA